MIRANLAVPFLKAIQPFVRQKAKQIQVALEFQEFQKTRKRGGGRRVPLETIAWREEKRIEILRLNGRNKCLRTPCSELKV